MQSSRAFCKEGHYHSNRDWSL